MKNILITGSSGFLGEELVNYFSKDNIIITPGSKEGMFLMHQAFNGDIILPAPSWVSYEPQANISSNLYSEVLSQ